MTEGEWVEEYEAPRAVEIVRCERCGKLLTVGQWPWCKGDGEHGKQSGGWRWGSGGGR